MAGGGTGFTTLQLGLQLRHRQPRLVYLDFSLASLETARFRAGLAGLAGLVEWVEASILDLPDLGLGQFDLIECSGVLHHLADPGAGLAVLAASLAPTGGLALMLYARVARTGIYQLQELLRLVNSGVADMEVELGNTFTLLAGLSLPALQRRAETFQPDAFWTM